MKALYTTEVTSTGGRDGKSKSNDGNLEVSLTTAKELGGAGGVGTNPEQLYGAGHSACFLSAVKFVAGQEKLHIHKDATVTAQVGVGARDDGGGFGLEVTLTIHVPELDRAKVEDLVAKAHIVCPYSHATRGNIPVTLVVV
ncbi:MAG: organic hydroperoxide resistance protein [Chthoniobacterales bacterium]